MTTPTKRRRTRVLVGDHQEMFRRGFTEAIKSWPEFEVVGAVDADAILPSLQELRPDVAVLDPTSLDEETQDEIFACACDEIRLLFVSGTASDESYVAMTRGAIGCLTKSVTPRELCEAVAKAARGEPHMAKNTHTEIATSIRLRNAPNRPYLTARQLQVVAAAAQGCTNQQIAKQLVIAEATVKAHFRAIHTSLGTRNRTAAVYEALRHRLIE
jgi:two-component system, NarL family, nitrate/nitrite response regulator NarL